MLPCRQKTLGQHTQCCKCNRVQGQLCGDCLYMRYGENVLEARQNPNWICPACRGICNCNRCRKAKGWARTGLIYRKVLRLGFKSVAHYLIETRRMQTNQEVAAAEDQVPVKRSTSFADTEAESLHDVSLKSDKHTDGVVKPESPRRSSRLTTMTPICYTERIYSKKGKSAEDEEIYIPEGSKPEIYTEEHDKLLGDCKASWTLRIYDQVNGKTCHQCRQKTLGQHSQCCKCNLEQGQLCGDCLYMRYGENVLEASQNPNWICPACRGICNCSLCREAKGWAPTGLIYRKVLRLGFKSVAHYLIQTRRTQTNQEIAAAEVHVPAKRSMSFTDTEAEEPLHDMSLDSDKHPDGILKPESQVIKVVGIDETEKEDDMNATCEGVDSYGGSAYDSADNDHILRERERTKLRRLGYF